MANAPANGFTLDATAAQIVRRHPYMLRFFDHLGVDDCCLHLDLRTIAAHHGLDPEALLDEVNRALREAGTA